MAPTENEIRAAKEWIVSRLGMERAAEEYLGRILRKYARMIAEVSLRYGIAPQRFRFSANPALEREVRAILAQVRDLLYGRAEYSCTFGKDGDEHVSPVFLEADKGKTFRQRLAEYVSRWGYEVEAGIAAALLSGSRDVREIADMLVNYVEHPYENPEVRKHRGEGAASKLLKVPHYGGGRAIAAFAALALLLRQTTARAWMREWKERNGDALGFYVMRGSSYPCSACDMECGYLHPMSDEGVVPVHPNCCCYTVYVRRKDYEG